MKTEKQYCRWAQCERVAKTYAAGVGPLCQKHADTLEKTLERRGSRANFTTLEPPTPTS